MKKKWVLPMTVATVLMSAHAQANGTDYCREYTQTVQVGGVRQQGYGTACMQPDGSWQIVESAEGSAMASNAVISRTEYAEVPPPMYVPAYAPAPQPSFSMVVSSGAHRHRHRHGNGHGHWRHGGHRGHHW